MPHIIWALSLESIRVNQSKVLLTASSVTDNSKLQLTSLLLLLEQVSGKKRSNQFDFIRPLIKTPFDIACNGESKADASIQICHDLSTSKKSPKLQNQESADN